MQIETKVCEDKALENTMQSAGFWRGALLLLALSLLGAALGLRWIHASQADPQSAQQVLFLQLCALAGLLWLLARQFTPLRFFLLALITFGLSILINPLSRPETCILAPHFPGTAWNDISQAFVWPLSHPLSALLAWAPALGCLGHWVTARRGRTFPPASCLLALSTLLFLILLTCCGVKGSCMVKELMILGVVSNAACLFAAFPAPLHARSIGLVALASLWFVTVGDALLKPAPLSAQFARIEGGGTALARAKSIRLPETRPSLPLDPEADTGAEVWRPGAAPAFENAPGLPVYGTWSSSGAAAMGGFRSKVLLTSSPLLKIFICGDLKPPESSLVLRTEGGRDILPFETRVSSPSRWKQLNFSAPEEPFRVVATDASRTLWLAFSAPVELSTSSWLLGKIPRSWPGWLFLGLAAGLPALLTLARREGGQTPRQIGTSSVWRLFPWLLLLAYAVFFSRYIDTTAGPNDSGGYLCSAKNLASGHISAAPRLLPLHLAQDPGIKPFLPTTFLPMKNGSMAPEYPLGFPLIIAALAQVMPLHAAVPVAILGQLVLGIIFTWLLAKAMGLPESWAWFAAFIIGLCPVYLFQALQPQSDGPALVWVTAAIWLAWRSREKAWLAVPAGLATALAVLIRPSNLLCVLPLLVCLSGSWRRLLFWGFAGLPGALFLATANGELYGHWLRTGYGDMGGSFSLRFLVPTLKAYASWLPLFLTPLVLLAFAGPFLKVLPLRVRLVLGLWIATFMAFYAVYWCTYDNWYNMRFVLPAAPAMVVLALLVLRHAFEKAGFGFLEGASLLRSRLPSALTLLFAACFLVACISEYQVLFWPRNNHRHEVGAVWAKEHLPKDAVLYATHATNSLLYYTDLLIVREDLKLSRSPEFLAAVEATGRPVYALLYDWELRNGAPSLPGAWKPLATLWNGDITAWERTR